jgi:4,5-DOPA dioxygenase extradiol
MPVLFVGHGSPLNAIADNAFTQALGKLGEKIPRPKAICVLSAHWVTAGTEVLVSAQPETIHDFYGFPAALYQIQYPAPGAPVEAEEAAAAHAWRPATDWGFDHGTWSVLRHLYPAADVPVFQVSLDQRIGMREHLAIGKQLGELRERGVLIVGSGNIVHNLRRIDFQADARPYEWAVEFDARVERAVEARDVEALTAFGAWGEAVWRAAHPTLEHYLPLLYCLGAASPSDEVRFPHEGIEHGSISMRMVLLGEG